MSVHVPVEGLCDLSAFAESVESLSGGVSLLRDICDKTANVCSSDCDAFCRQAAKDRFLGRIAIAERERAEGKSIDAEQVIADLKVRYGL